MCFFFVSRYMDEENQWGSEIKKQKLQKKKHPQLHQPAPPCDDSASWMSSWSITKPTFHYLALQCCTSPGPRRMWRKKKPHFPRQISIFLSPSTRQRSCTTAVSACNQRQRKNKNSPVHKHMAAQNVAFCVFFLVCFFFLELGKINERV